MEKKEKIWVVYDERYYLSPDDAMVMLATSNEKDAKEFAKENNYVAVEEEVVDKVPDDSVVDAIKAIDKTFN